MGPPGGPVPAAGGAPPPGGMPGGMPGAPGPGMVAPGVRPIGGPPPPGGMPAMANGPPSGECLGGARQLVAAGSGGLAMGSAEGRLGRVVFEAVTSAVIAGSPISG